MCTLLSRLPRPPALQATTVEAWVEKSSLSPSEYSNGDKGRRLPGSRSRNGEQGQGLPCQPDPPTLLPILQSFVSEKGCCRSVVEAFRSSSCMRLKAP